MVHGGHCITHLQKQTDALFDIQTMEVTVLINVLAINVLNHQIGYVVIRYPAFKQAFNVRVVEGQQHLQLIVEAVQYHR